MTEEVLNEFRAKINELSEKIKSLPESSANGQLIDALSHAQSVEEHLRRYYMLKQSQGAAK